MEEMKEGIAFAHERQVKVYVTANILAHNTDLNGVREYFQELKEIGPDALIIADPGVFDIAKKSARRFRAISVLRQTTRIMEHTCSGTARERSVL